MVANVIGSGVQLGQSGVAVNNFVLRPNADGTLRLFRGSALAEGVEVLRIDASGNIQLGSSAVVTGKNQATAWVNFNGTGTVAILDSYNVSSITDNGTGDYTINFAVAMNNANYSPALGPYTNGNTSIAYGYLTKTTTQFRVRSAELLTGGTITLIDIPSMNVTFLGGK